MLSSLFAITHPTWYWTHVLIITLLVQNHVNSSLGSMLMMQKHVCDIKDFEHDQHQLDECLNKVSMQKKELHSQAHRSNASFKKNSTRQILLSDIMCVFSIEIRLLIILLSDWFFFKKGTWWLPLICKQTFFQLPVGWEDISAPNTKWLPQNTHPSFILPFYQRGRRGRRADKKEDDRSS